VIIGSGWGFLGLLAVGIVAFALIPGCGLVVVDKAPSGQEQLDAPPLVEVDARVEARTATVAAVALDRAAGQVRHGVLHVRTTGCDGKPTGAGFALGPKLVLAPRDVLPGAGALRVASVTGPARALDTSRVYRLGDFAIAQVDGRLPHRMPAKGSVALGSSVAVVGYPLSADPRLTPGVVVDRIAGTPFGVRGPVLRLTSILGHGEPGGPVIDAGGRIVGVAFATDPRTGFAVAAPIDTLDALVAKRALEALPSCGGA
jgi:hypothetical protein